MSRKSKSLIVLTVIFLFVTAVGGIYTWSIQGNDLQKQEVKLNKLKSKYSNIQSLKQKLSDMEKQVSVVDSLLFTGKFSIPQNLPQSNFYNFIDQYSKDNSIYTFTNTEFLNENAENGFNYYTYTVYGVGYFDDVYGLVYAIEHSRELKKIYNSEIRSATSVDKRGVPHYLVKFNLEVRVYFSYSDQYAAIKKSENDLSAENLYNTFYPLVRNEIRPNVNNLPDIQDATLISLVPQGAFITDAKGNTHLLAKGDRVYLGYLTELDYKKETVTFVLNKGGIIEHETLKMGKKNKKEGN